MKITDVDVWVVNLPLVNPFTSSFETKTGETRTVVRIRTDAGTEGWGETMWGAPVAAIVRQMIPDLIGTSPFARESFFRKQHMVPFFYGYLGYAATAAVDVACWDAMGKATGQSVTDLLGGAVREEVPLTALITRADAPGATSAGLPAAMAEHAVRVVTEGGFTAVKLKGTRDWEGDVAILRAVRDALPEVNLRVDPNAAWSVPDSVRAGIALEELDLEYLEDPCTGIEGMSQVKAKVRIPLCTNMCVVRFEEFAPAVRLNAVDVIHGDVYKWGGIAATKALAAHCETFGLGMNLHSGGELGIATAAHLAVVASTPVLSRAIDSMYYLHADDIIEPLHLENGRLRVPSGPGLGVRVDEDKLRHYAGVNEREGDLTG
ncbi:MULTISPECIES: mandelate racemase/muconate lactonizing enzyme family protein [Streptomyces]|uniref:mandelate racemase/muconate lactonizing enzyme family protein n=1 Tax=Streptomyces TaxID=1883 RepID=UPI00072304ED|nr:MULTISPECIES: enolase C-terminal domain-like protein [unclassified Streptomyces]ALM36738.1 isomerase [Streptomyces sp. FR-008]KAF0789870.1 isomerase [Streptomyces sp. FR-008]NVI30376.1 isomerase [Streptomyces sp. CAI-17]